MTNPRNEKIRVLISNYEFTSSSKGFDIYFLYITKFIVIDFSKQNVPMSSWSVYISSILQNALEPFGTLGNGRPKRPYS